MRFCFWKNEFLTGRTNFFFFDHLLKGLRTWKKKTLIFFILKIITMAVNFKIKVFRPILRWETPIVSPPHLNWPLGTWINGREKKKIFLQAQNPFFLRLSDALSPSWSFHLFFLNLLKNYLISLCLIRIGYLHFFFCLYWPPICLILCTRDQYSCVIRVKSP